MLHKLTVVADLVHSTVLESALPFCASTTLIINPKHYKYQIVRAVFTDRAETISIYHPNMKHMQHITYIALHSIPPFLAVWCLFNYIPVYFNRFNGGVDEHPPYPLGDGMLTRDLRDLQDQTNSSRLTLSVGACGIATLAETRNQHLIWISRLCPPKHFSHLFASVS